MAEGWLNTNCPLCHDVKYKGGFNTDGGYFHCWRCGGHDLAFIISKILRINFFQAKIEAEKYSTQEIARKKLNRKKEGGQPLKSIPGYPTAKQHHHYLESRNFEPEKIIKYYDIRGTGAACLWHNIDYSNRIIIPIYHRKKIVSFQGRSIVKNEKVRYKSCPPDLSPINYKSTLYGTPHRDQAIVVEGITDVWRIGEGAMATYGTTITPAQIKALAKLQKVFFLFDQEQEAQHKATQAAQILASLNVKAEVIRYHESIDPGEFSHAQVGEIRRELGFYPSIFS